MKTELTSSKVIAHQKTASLPLRDVTQMSSSRQPRAKAKKPFKRAFCAVACAVGLSWQAAAGVPQITAVNPLAAKLGDTVTISGANFDANPANDIVHFGAVEAQVTSASATSLTVLVPRGATYAPVSVTVGGLTANARLPFAVKFNSVGGAGLTADVFSDAADLPANAGEMAAVAIADIDGDGKPDVIVANRAAQSISVFRNLRDLSTPGTITATSFASKVDFPATAPSDGPVAIAVADLDGDGKLDVVVAEPTGSTIFVFRNTSTVGSVSFAPAISFVEAPGVTGLAIADIDGDGRPDIAFCTTSQWTVGVLRNTSTPGALDTSSFAPAVSLAVGSDPLNTVVIADMDGDGRPDVIAATSAAGGGDNAAYITIWRNISTVGNLAFEAPFNLDASYFTDPNLTLPDYDAWTGVAIGDLNGDGIPDIVVGSDVPGVIQNNSVVGSFSATEFEYVVFNRSGGGIAGNQYRYPFTYHTEALADFVGDGQVDIAGAGALNLGGPEGALTVGNDPLIVEQNPTAVGADLSTSSGLFFGTVSSSVSAEAIAVGDLDGDGKPDIVAVYAAGGKVSILQNTISSYSVTSLSPASAPAGSAGFVLTLNGLGFENGAIAFWNGAALPTTFVSRTSLQASVPAADLMSSANLATAAITVFNPDGGTSSPMLFTITGSGVGTGQSVFVGPDKTATVASPSISTPLTTAGQAAVSVTVNNLAGSTGVSATAAAYTGNPTSASIIDVGGGYVDLKISVASSADSAVAYFYYPSSITGTAEPSLVLQYYNGNNTWAQVLSSGGVAPVQDTTDNLDGTTSGGRFTVVFDGSSTPPISALSGTVFAMAPRDTTPPTIQCPANVVTGTDPGLCSAVVRYSVTASDDAGAPTLVCVPPSGAAFPRGTTTVNCTATDGSGNQAVCSFTVTVNDTQAPVVGAISAPVTPTAVDTSVAAGAKFTDNCGPHTALWNWGDGSTSPGTVSEANGSGSVTGGHVYTAAGVYTLTLTVTEEAGNQGQGTFEFVVVYDPNAGFVTGGGWINSPAGAYVANPNLSGKATFGFVSKYQKGASVPTGQTEFQFQMASFDFKSTAYQWLVIAGAKAQYKGTGTINGVSGYSFILSATDGEINGGGGVDKFRIHITNTATGGTVYDNVPGAADDINSANPEAIAGGDIVIHSN